ncbi:hypothetical protein, partial [Alicyclobacillus acidiphilus]
FVNVIDIASNPVTIPRSNLHCQFDISRVERAMHKVKNKEDSTTGYVRLETTQPSEVVERSVPQLQIKCNPS